ncbi:hypothetical protein ANCCAN_19621 [Ancylostoma caninum]|uniref:SXP/RAL-2 family protein Ani s 5-like cation-binding domain-containing protein n=1 Tax=Ancylostoma caninum TaxID=29170 RepID=A0A368FQT8_ANCCA|nr:hypothetical protein ANCCAN_19621 [Ancylostoma caninum]
MKTLLLFAVVVVCALAYDPVFVDELEDLVFTKEEKWELETLDDDDTMIRSEKQKKLDEILAKQPQAVQDRFKNIVETRKLRHQKRHEMKIEKATDPEIKEFWKEIEKIDNDMGISEDEAEMKEWELKAKLTPEQRKML